jgi:hypothetical protein
MHTEELILKLKTCTYTSKDEPSQSSNNLTLTPICGMIVGASESSLASQNSIELCSFDAVHKSEGFKECQSIECEQCRQSTFLLSVVSCFNPCYYCASTEYALENMESPIGRNLEKNLHTNENPTWITFDRVTIKEENKWHHGKRIAPWSSSLFIVNR